MRRITLIAGIVALATIFATPASGASGMKLHPSGFGAHSYASWKADEGLQDSTGNKDQALYFQKQTATETFAAGIAVFRGVAGLDTQSLLPLAFDVRTDGWCGAGAPRFNVRIQPEGTTDPALSQTEFIGCQAMMPGPTQTYEDRTFQRRTYSGPLPAGTVVSLAIVFDEGLTIEMPPGSGMSVPLGPGKTWLDNIQVGDYIWSSASDNGGGNTPVTSAEAQSILGEPFDVALVS